MSDIAPGGAPAATPRSSDGPNELSPMVAADDGLPAQPDRPPDVRTSAAHHYARANRLLRWADSDNIAAELEQEQLNRIGDRVFREFTIDENSRAAWRTRTEKAHEVAMQVAKEKTYPWPKASNVLFPLMTNAALQFAARAYPAIVNGNQVVRGSIVGDDDGVPMTNPKTGQPVMQPNGQPFFIVQPGAKKDRALRIGEHMSWQLLDEDPEGTWESETDQLLHMLPIVGCVFRKSYPDPVAGRSLSRIVPALKLTINYKAKNVGTAPRATEEVPLYPYEVEELERSGSFIHHDYGQPPDAGDDREAQQIFLEQHRRLDLDDDGYPEPYIVTIHKQTRKVARIVARYDADMIFFRSSRLSAALVSVGDLRLAPARGMNFPPEMFADLTLAKIEAIQYYTQYDFLPSMDGGPYGTGFGNLLAPINEAINTTLNQMLDAGHLQNTGGGFLGKGLGLQAGAVRFQIGEWKPVAVAGGTLKDNLVPIPFPGPSAVLYQLLSLLIESGKEIAAIKDILSGDKTNANMPATTVLALIQQGLTVFTAIYKRIYRALKTEFQKLYRLNRVFLPHEGMRFRRGDKQFDLQPGDYADDMMVEPVSDPNTVSPMQKLARAQMLLSLMGDQSAARFLNGQAVMKRIMESAMVEKSDELLLPAPPPDPMMIAEAVKVQQRALELKADASRQKAAEVRDLAQSILFLAQAKKAEHDIPLAWFDQQLEVVRHNFEAKTRILELQQQASDAAGAQAPPAAPGAPAQAEAA